MNVCEELPEIKIISGDITQFDGDAIAKEKFAEITA